MGQITSSIALEEIQILYEFFHSLNGFEWKYKKHWCQNDIDPSLWYGISTRDGHIIEINLKNNGLRGILPSSIGKLKYLETLNLSGNALHGTLPKEIGQLCNLKHLNLSMNSIQGSVPKEIGQLHQLITLNLGENLFSGLIPVELSCCIQIEAINMEHNGFKGTLSIAFQQFHQLKQWNLRGNALHGPLPSFFHCFEHLEWFSCRGNRFSGSLPNDLGTCSKLHYLDLSNNFFTGRIPTAIAQLPQLRLLNLHQNRLRGPIPIEFQSCTSLEQLDYRGNNDLEPSLPIELYSTIPFHSILTEWSMLRQNQDLISSIPSDFAWKKPPPVKALKEIKPFLQRMTQMIQEEHQVRRKQSKDPILLSNHLMIPSIPNSIKREQGQEERSPSKILIESLQSSFSTLNNEENERISIESLLDEKYQENYANCTLRNSRVPVI